MGHALTLADALARCNQMAEAQKTGIESKTHHDHEFKKINNHDHEIRVCSKKDPAPFNGTSLFRLVNTDPLFTLAVSWGCWPQALYNAARQYGPDSVRAKIALVKNYTGVRNKAAYLMASLKNANVGT